MGSIVPIITLLLAYFLKSAMKKILEGGRLSDRAFYCYAILLFITWQMLFVTFWAWFSDWVTANGLTLLPQWAQDFYHPWEKALAPIINAAILYIPMLFGLKALNYPTHMNEEEVTKWRENLSWSFTKFIGLLAGVYVAYLLASRLLS